MDRWSRTLEEEFVLTSAVIDVRNRVGLTQEEVARKMGNQGAGLLLHDKRFMQNAMFRHGAG